MAIQRHAQIREPVPPVYRWVRARVFGREDDKVHWALISDLRDHEALETPDLCKLFESNPTLYREFADMELTQPGILKVVHKYGTLTGYAMDLILTERDEARGSSRDRGELFEAWHFHISEIVRLTSVWDLFQRGDTAALSRFIRWQTDTSGKSSVVFECAPDPSEGGTPPEVIASADFQPRSFSQLQPGDILAPARVYVENKLADHLQSLTQGEHVGATMGWDPNLKRRTLRNYPQTLLGALWLSFAECVSSNQTHRRCRQCHKWFQVGPGAARARREFCSTVCRVTAYHGRQEESRRLFSDGVSLEEIARKVGADLLSVKRWVTRKKK